jgi:hypothetical protein
LFEAVFPVGGFAGSLYAKAFLFCVLVNLPQHKEVKQFFKQLNQVYKLLACQFPVVKSVCQLHPYCPGQEVLQVGHCMARTKL